MHQLSEIRFNLFKCNRFLSTSYLKMTLKSEDASSANSDVTNTSVQMKDVTQIREQKIRMKQRKGQIKTRTYK